ncbi:type IV pilin-like G/H family protein [Limnospira fusiformis KN01]|uniref:type IV pilin-like G/H family protein n=1 Tax=Limnospira TaxID=2596745 RepID=UPI001658732C|nr:MULTISPECIES: type IV pilin-like G/H family protein [Limnospira]MDT9198995.1 type IV pilin-like G/H family protein [Limnospira sp. PMC 1042.18]ULB47112.1 type IV pilin-like G/H family protein [Limnospira fusiformis KN01]
MNNNGSDKSKFTPLVWFLMGSGVSLVLLLGGWGLWFFGGASESSNFLKISLTSSRNEAKAADQLIGHWQLETFNDEMPPSLFFTEDNVFLVGTSENQADVVASYSIESDDQVNYLLILGSDHENSPQFIVAIFDFPDRDQLRIEFLMSDNSDGSRPATSLNFSNDAVVYERVSTVISDNIEIHSQEQQKAREMQVEPQQFIRSILRAQQAFYMERGQFSDSLRALGLGLPDETDNYSYKFVYIDQDRMVQVAAQAKKSFLKSYTGIVYFSGGITSIIMCESNETTTELPPQARLNQDGKFACPDGYSEL